MTYNLIKNSIFQNNKTPGWKRITIGHSYILMQHTDIVIIGAGAAGLMAAYELTKAGKQVLVLEARNRLGGRIHTLYDAGFSVPAEAGAEFVHGDLPLSLQLLKEADIKNRQMQGTTWEVENSILKKSETLYMEGWDVLLEKLSRVTEDQSIEEFLNTHFSDEKDAALKQSVIGFVQGYDAADTTKASTLALREEWMSEDDAPQHRMPDGYGKLVQYLANETQRREGKIALNTWVTHINWQAGHVTLTTRDGETHQANRVILTLPLGIWQAKPGNEGYVAFEPELSEKRDAAQRMGFGQVIKFLLEFRRPFWEEKGETPTRKMPNLGFLFSDATIPTWWTQLPQPIPLLAGWLAGPNALQYQSLSQEQLLKLAIDSLAQIFDTTPAFIQNELRHGEVFNWTTDPLTQGAYAYATVGGAEARQLLAQPVENTLFFAGEALYEGPEMGTVEAALASGKAVAEQLLAKP